MSNILSFLNDDDGNQSSMRIIVFLIIACVLFNWTFLTVKTGAWIKLDIESIMMVLGSMGFKAVQKNIELNKNSQQDQKQ